MKKILIISILMNIGLAIAIVFLYHKNLNMPESSHCNKQQVLLYPKKDSLSLRVPNDPLRIYYSKKFTCGSGPSSYEANICTGEKLRFADSLLSDLVKNKIKMLDQEILVDKEAIEKTGKNNFFITALKSNSFKKIKLIKSQNLWNEMRVLESKDVSLECGDAAAGCPGVVSNAEIKIVLERMKEINEIKAYN
jgi:hypothetical protein